MSTEKARIKYWQKMRWTGWFQRLWIFIPIWGKLIYCIFSKWLKPPHRWILRHDCNKMLVYLKHGKSHHAVEVGIWWCALKNWNLPWTLVLIEKNILFSEDSIPPRMETNVKVSSQMTDFHRFRASRSSNYLTMLLTTYTRRGWNSKTHHHHHQQQQQQQQQQQR